MFDTITGDLLSRGLQLASTVLAEFSAGIRRPAVGAEFGLGGFLYRCRRDGRGRAHASLAVLHGLFDLFADHGSSSRCSS